MSRNLRVATFSFLLLVISGLVLFSWFSASASLGPALVTPSITTSVSTTVTTAPSSTTTSTQTSAGLTTTTITSTSTSLSISSSYTSTTSLTITNTTTSTTNTATVTVGATSTSVTTSTTSPTFTQTQTTTSTSTVANFPSCLIATATFGSQLAPEVQLLRNFRDNAILRTSAGSSFMILFNAWYYSYSPSVANYLTDHWVERTVMKGVLYPLIGILDLSSATFAATSFLPELAVLFSGLVTSFLIGIVYVGLPLGFVRAGVRRLRGFREQSSLEYALAILMLGGIATLGLGEILTSMGVMMVASVTVVLSTMSLSAIFTSGCLARKLSA